MNLRRPLQLFACMALAATASGASCFTPCILADCATPSNGLDGHWQLATINGAGIATFRPGFRIPDGTEYVPHGSMNFTSLEWDEDEHTGSVSVSYGTVNAAGSSPHEYSHTGTFEYSPKTGRLVLRVAGKGGAATVSGTTITAGGVIPAFGSANIAFTKNKPVR